MVSSKVKKQLIPKDYKNINKYISSPVVKQYLDKAICLSSDCKVDVTNLLCEKFIDFMTPIEDIMRGLFNDLSIEIMRRYQEIFSTKNHEDFKKNLELVSSCAIHKLYSDLENEILTSGTIILEKSNTIDAVYEIYNEYEKAFNKVVLSSTKLKILAVINQLEFIQIDTKNYINNLVKSVSKEAFDLYSEQMDRYFLDIQSFINTNNSVISEYLEIKLENNNDAIIDEFNQWINETKSELNETKNKIFTHYKYQELNKIAVDNGFVLKRVTGGHGIFINKKGLITVIPQGRDIGKGLQIKILKSLGVRE